MKNAGKFMCEKVVAFALLASLFLLTTCTQVPDHCGGKGPDTWVNLDHEFCFGGVAHPRCGGVGGLEFNPRVEQCIAGDEIGVICADGAEIPRGALCGRHRLTVAAVPQDGGGAEIISHPDETEFNAGEYVMITASANPDFEFIGWTGTITDTASSREIRILRPTSVVAMFRPTRNELVTTAFPEIGGTITRSPDKEVYGNGDRVTVTAHENEGYSFVGWSGASTSTSSTINITMNGGQTLVAIFEPALYTLNANANPEIGGAVFVNGTALAGAARQETDSRVELLAQAADGYVFTHWSGDAGGTANPVFITIRNANQNVVANFEPRVDAIPTYTLSVSRTPVAGGSVSVGGTINIADGASSVTSVHNHGAQVEVCAITLGGYAFAGWSGASTSANSCVNITMNQSRTLTANFVLNGSGGGEDNIEYYCLAASCAAQIGTSVPEGCYTEQSACIAEMPQQNITQYCPVSESCNVVTNMPTLQVGCYLLLADCEATLTPTCTAGLNCPTDLGSCTVGGTCTNNVQRSNCAGTFVFNNTCPIIADPPESGSFTDGRDGQTYRYVTIGTQTWMAENLNFAGSGGSAVGVCYNNNTSNCDLYGRLYRWVEAMDIDQQYETSLWGGSNVGHRGICPSGWHLPSDNEWQTLVDFVGGSSIAGTKLKSQTGWDTEGPWGAYIPGTDDFGFSALPGGYGWGGDFGNVGFYGYWWSASELDADLARGRIMYYDGESVISVWYNKDDELSVRCVRD